MIKKLILLVGILLFIALSAAIMGNATTILNLKSGLLVLGGLC